MAAAVAFVERLRKGQAWVPTIKLVIAYSQVISSIPSVYDVVMPDLFNDWIGWLNFFSFRWAFEVGVPSACVGGGLAERIAVYGLAPLVLMLALPLLGLGLRMTTPARLQPRSRPPRAAAPEGDEPPMPPPDGSSASAARGFFSPYDDEALQEILNIHETYYGDTSAPAAADADADPMAALGGLHEAVLRTLDEPADVAGGAEAEADDGVELGTPPFAR